MENSHQPPLRWQCTWHAGPDAGAVHTFGPGSHVLGRAAHATLTADDPALAPHHAVLEVGPDGRGTLTQLAGGPPIRVDGAAMNGGGDGPVELAAGAWLEVGTSLLRLQRGGEPLADGAVHLHCGAVVRSARAVSQWTPQLAVTPDPPGPGDERAGGLLPALAGVAASGVLALVLRQPTFILFGLLGAVVAIASWGAQRIAFARRHRRALAAHQCAVQAARDADARARVAFRAHHEQKVPTVVTALGVAHHRGDRLWARRLDHGDATLAALGLGDVAWPLPDDRATHSQPPVAGMAIAVDLRAGSRLAVRGPQARGVARSLLMQLATSCGPADVRIVIVTAQPTAWASLRDLPHLTLPDESSAVIDETGLATVLAEWEGHRGQLVVVTDDPALLAVRTSPLRRLLADTSAHALIAVLPTDATVPHICTAALTTTDGPTAQWVADTSDTASPQCIRVAALGERSATRTTAALRGLVDPEDPLSMATNMPRALSLVDLHGGALADAEAILHTWATVGRDPAPRALVGMAVDGAVDIDLVRDGPHGLIAGTTGAGKSELLRTLVVGMAANARPEHLTFVLIDYKGGATFDACAALPHVVGVITDLDEHLADRALRSLHAELRRREALLRAHGAADLPALRATDPQVVLPRLVVVIDEFAALVSEQPTFLHALVGVAQRGRSLGVHLLLATQRPQGVISDDVRANTNLRLALRLQDAADALDVAGTADAAHLPRSVPGRAVLRLGADEHVTFQTAHCTQHADGDESPLQLLVGAIVEAARQTDEPAPVGPWQPPLPAMLHPSEVPHGALGLIDDPDQQRIRPLHRDSDEGHLLIAGSAGSGATSTLCTLAAHTLATTSDHVYVLDAHGTNEFDGLAQHPRCGAVIRIRERERVARLLHRLRARSGDPAATSPRIVLVIDGLDTARRALDHPSTMDEYDVLHDLLTTADANAVTIIAAVEHTAAVSAAFIARCADRWVLHLHDPHDGAALGAHAANVPPAQPGRVYLATCGLTAQLVRPGEPLHQQQPITDPLAPPAPRIDTVPPIVIASSLAPGTHHDGTTALSIGVDVTTGRTHVLRVHLGEHVLVVGGARTGRTTALAHLAAQWRRLHPDGWVGALTLRRGGPLDALPVADLDELRRGPHDRPALLIVDDADRVDDADGRLAALAAGGRVCLFAAGKPDALRLSYGHWTGVVRRSRIGLVAAGGSELDGDLLGTLLPRRTPIAPRPGLMWAIDDSGPHLTQVAIPGGDRCTDLLPH